MEWFKVFDINFYLVLSEMGILAAQALYHAFNLLLWIVLEPHMELRFQLQCELMFKIYQNRKQQLATDVLGVCDRDRKFVNVLPRWQGSASDFKVCVGALTRSYPLVIPYDTISFGIFYITDLPIHF